MKLVWTHITLCFIFYQINKNSKIRTCNYLVIKILILYQKTNSTKNIKLLIKISKYNLYYSLLTPHTTRILPHKLKESSKQCHITITLLLTDKSTTTTHTNLLMTRLFFPLNPPLMIIIRPDPLWNKPPSQYHTIIIFTHKPDPHLNKPNELICFRFFLV